MAKWNVASWEYEGSLVQTLYHCQSQCIDKSELRVRLRFALTSPLTAAGSRALLMQQPSTGVLGEADIAMLSSLLNISDSVPPAQMRWDTTSQFPLRDLQSRE